MFRTAVIACLALCACTPEQKAAEDMPPITMPNADAPPAQAATTQSAEVTVVAPLSGARISSPVSVEGIAPNNWFFEAVFPLELSVDGEVISEAPAQAQTDWTVDCPVKFRGELKFNVAAEREAILTLAEDMPREDAQGNALPARVLKIPVVLLPSK
jgi:Immunoglobulin-like domain of bacterial spore germination